MLCQAEDEVNGWEKEMSDFKCRAHSWCALTLGLAGGEEKRLFRDDFGEDQ